MNEFNARSVSVSLDKHFTNNFGSLLRSGGFSSCKPANISIEIKGPYFQQFVFCSEMPVVESLNRSLVLL